MIKFLLKLLQYGEKTKNLIDTATSKERDLLINYGILFIILIIGEMILDAALSIIKVPNTEAISNRMR